jgi:predicted Fe-Mo cluster-binding NifX family protein
MSYKVAVASSDGKVINQHFGRSRQFLVFNITDDRKIEFLELREGEPPCGFGEHNDDLLAKAVAMISDCRFLLASQIGPGAEGVLRSKGIRTLLASDYINKVLEKLAQTV